MAKLMRLSRHAAPLSTGPIAELFGSLCRQMGLGRRVRLLISREPVAPMTFGTLRPAVMLSSQAVEELSHDEIATILAHELAHHSRFDPWVNWLQAAVAVVWWFNPVVWLLNRAIHRVREDCCDDLILQRGLTNGRLYGQTLLHVAERLAVRISPGLAWPAQQMHPLTARMARVMDCGLRASPRKDWT
jgi:beta-lactamase regulating signal transducer with metallopeptidase domain